MSDIKVSSFTDQQPREATDYLIKNWGGNGKRFRCYLCGHKFQIGDIWRWQYSNRYFNFLVCEKCDGLDVIDKWIDANIILEEKYWWAFED